MDMEARIAAAGSAMGDPVRAAILVALIDGRALPAGELAFVGNVAPQTASFHLSKLVETGLLRVEQQGKHRYYRLADERVGDALECMAALYPVAPRTVGDSGRKRELGFARSCYKHLAGRMAVDLYDSLLQRQYVVAGRGREVRLSELGLTVLSAMGMLADKQRVGFAMGRTCLDWTERRPHMGGPLGVAMFGGLQQAGWMVPLQGSRAVRLTHLGEERLQRDLGLRLCR